MTNIVVLTGAGLSAESGLGTFRDAGGLWSSYDLEDVATPEGYARNPALVHDFYNARRQNCLSASPNPAHQALARLQAAATGRVTLITQNIDDLLERAGATAVIHMHGEILRALCARCGHRWDAPPAMDIATNCPACTHPAARPDVVWFGEIPYRMDDCLQAIAAADLFAAIGTSGQVYPAAGFVEEARLAGAETVEINLDSTDASGRFDRHVTGPASLTVPAWVDDVLTA